MNLINGDCIEAMKGLDDNSVDAVVTDPPYELGFMGKAWDNTGIANNKDMWAECLRVLKPGGHLLAFSGTRTYHRMACAIEDAGFEIRNQLIWAFGSGFPKSANIQKHLQKMGSDRADEFKGFGTQLKPAFEPICMARKPLAEKSVAANCLKWGTGGINIDESRVDLVGIEEHSTEGKSGLGNNVFGKYENKPKELTDLPRYNSQGRFPANLILSADEDGQVSEEVRACFPEASKGWGKSTNSDSGKKSMFGIGGVNNERYDMGGGNASRFFKSIIYTAKASKAERGVGNIHATVKPIALMEYLINMITPKAGTVLDPFMGSGTTGVAAKRLSRDFIGIELDAEYFKIAETRINADQGNLQQSLF